MISESQCSRNHSAQCFRHSRHFASRLTNGNKYFQRVAVSVVINSDKSIPYRSRKFIRRAINSDGTGFDYRHIHHPVAICLGKICFFIILYSEVQDLVTSAAVTKNSNSLAISIPGKHISLLYVFYSGLVRKVYCFANGVVRVLLESGLCLYMPIGVNFVSGTKNPFDILRYPLYVTHGSALGNLFHQLLAIESTSLGHLFKKRIDKIQSPVFTFDNMLICNREKRLYSTRRVGKYSDRTGRRDRRYRRVSDFLSLCINAFGPQRKSSPFLGKLLGSLVALLIYKPHNLLSQAKRFFAVVGNSESNQHIRPAAHSKANSSDTAYRFPDLRKRKGIHFDDTIQEPD